ncbi:hypothetical protein [Mucilaginibacter defluvii]|uniref:Uncharacterized protein n=1 Tax=Mucilaginibacter defluvii TaxID=1196019 RepID=A0ABP9G0U3_9SPHI
MKFESCEKRNVTTEQAIKLLREQGYEVTEEQATQILDFLYFLGKLSVDQYFKNKQQETTKEQTNETS